MPTTALIIHASVKHKETLLLAIKKNPTGGRATERITQDNL